MNRKARAWSQPSLRIDSEVARQIRQHARAESKTEVCGVLIGKELGDGIAILACIAGINAAQGGAHVTFTQDTWEHIYKIKDSEYPNERIVGWYHSHPGFGVFLSDHDTFIHKNFFSSPHQVAWVYDPHSDEEGCFGWQGDRVVRLTLIDIVDRHGGEGAEKSHQLTSAPAGDSSPDSTAKQGIEVTSRNDLTEENSLERLAAAVLSHLAVLLLGFAISYFLFPKVLVMAVPVDPLTGTPLGPMVEVPARDADALKMPPPTPDKAKDQARPANPAASPAKEGNGERR